MYIGLDLGTSALKGLLVDDRQHTVATASVPMTTAHREHGWSEQDPLSWIEATKVVLAKLRQEAPAGYAKVRAIGLSGQMHSLVALDDAQAPLRPAMLWNDVRGDAWCRRMIQEHPEFAGITGIRPMPSFTAAKLAWLRENEPDNFRHISHILLPKDFLRLWLTGEVATDASDAGGTQLFDQAGRRWSEEVGAELGLDSAVLPRILEGSEVAGRLRADVAATVGLDRVPVICGGGDAATSSLGTGCIAPGSSMLSLGTGAVYLSMQDTYQPLANESIHNFAHCLPDRWYHMAALLNCGSALEWACKVTGGRKAAEVLNEIEQGHRGPSPVMFLPYLDGVRTPHCNSEVRGSFFGLERASSSHDLVQAVIEGVTFALADADQALQASGDTVVSPLLLGGGARNPFWTSLIATLFKRPLRRVVEAETGSALGATRLAMIGIEVDDARTIAVEPQTDIVEPIGSMINAYEDRLADFRSMYAAVEAYSRLGSRAH